ncbi:MAG TPA: sigma-70 family RNA polymerase sigma factor [Microthrixaceae bacterium]|nr:sigma-70 family RNA polymerase sigma factor [Microthrixaceae bacterium]
MAGGDRPAVRTARDEVAAVWRIESARIVGLLARRTGDLALAEDVAQEAFAQALVSWPRDGIPEDPAAWLVAVAKRRAIDAFRRRSALDDRYATMSHGLADGETLTGRVASRRVGQESASVEDEGDPERISDDLLALMFTACHPALSPESRVSLTLRVVGGLTSDEIARAFLIPTATAQARITRAKKTLSSAGVPFAVPSPEERFERLGAVLSTIYVIFTEGSTATSGDRLIREDLAHEATRFARMLSRLMPEEPESHGLLALLELTAARFPARTGPDHEPVLLADQDRRRWDRSAIRRGRAALATARRVGAGLGAYGLQASIAECHAVARSVEETDWERIVVIYDALTRLAPSPIADLNRAVAVSMADGPAAALLLVDALAEDERLERTHLLPTVRGELLSRLGRNTEAGEEFAKALGLCSNSAERSVLDRKIAGLD